MGWTMMMMMMTSMMTSMSPVVMIVVYIMVVAEVLHPPCSMTKVTSGPSSSKANMASTEPCTMAVMTWLDRSCVRYLNLHFTRLK